MNLLDFLDFKVSTNYPVIENQFVFRSDSKILRFFDQNCRILPQVQTFYGRSYSITEIQFKNLSFTYEYQRFLGKTEISASAWKIL